MVYDLLIIIMILLSLLCLWRFSLFMKTFIRLSANNVVKSALRMLILAGYFGLMVVAYLIMFTTDLSTFSSEVKTAFVFVHLIISILLAMFIVRQYLNRNQ